MNSPDPSQWPEDGLVDVESLTPVFEQLGQARPEDAELLARMVDTAASASAGAGATTTAPAHTGASPKLLLGGTAGAVVLALGLAALGRGEGAPESVERVEAAARAPGEVEDRSAPLAHGEPLWEAGAPAAARRPAKPVPAEVVKQPLASNVAVEAPTGTGAENGADEARRQERQPSAAQLLAKANDARRDGHSQRALGLYASLLERFPGSREAQTALVARGRLQLDVLGRPEAAASDFERYLVRHPEGQLAREAAVGRAKAWRAAGQRAAEREAWEFVLARYPNTVHAATAQARLAQIE